MQNQKSADSFLLIWEVDIGLTNLCGPSGRFASCLQFINWADIDNCFFRHLRLPKWISRQDGTWGHFHSGASNLWGIPTSKTLILFHFYRGASNLWGVATSKTVILFHFHRGASTLWGIATSKTLISLHFHFHSGAGNLWGIAASKTLILIICLNGTMLCIGFISTDLDHRNGFYIFYIFCAQLFVTYIPHR